MGLYLQEASPRREKPRSVGPHRQCCQQFVVCHTSPTLQRCLMAHRRAVDLWSIHWCLCSRTDKPKLICRICRQRSLPAIRRLLDRLWLLTQDCDGAAVLTLRRWGCVATTPTACRGVSEMTRGNRELTRSPAADGYALSRSMENGGIGTGTGTGAREAGGSGKGTAGMRQSGAPRFDRKYIFSPMGLSKPPG